MDQNRFGLGIDRQGVVLLLMVAIIALALATAVLWIELRWVSAPPPAVLHLGKGALDHALQQG
jgi:hypothetical protein